MSLNNPEVILGMSNLCVSSGDALRFGADDYKRFLHDAGYSPEASLEVMPTRIPRMMRAMGDLAAQGVVGSLHESWRGTTILDVLGAARKGNLRAAAEEAVVVAGFPLLEKSYRPLQRIQDAAGRRFPLLVHPETQRLGEGPARRPRGTYSPNQFGPAWVQLTAEDIDACQPGILRADTATLADGIMAVNEVRETEIVADLHHVFMERSGKSFGTTDRIVQLLRTLHERGAIAEFQLSFRPDFGGRLSELRQAVGGNFRETPQGRTIAAIKDVPTRHPLRIMSEVRQGAIAALDLPKHTLYVDVHKRLTNNVRNLLA